MTDKVERNQQVDFTAFIWLGAILLFLALECLVIYSQVTRHLGSFRSLHFFCLPIMLSLPLSTGFPMYIKLKNSDTSIPIDTMNRISRFAALFMFVTYVTLLICLGESM